MPTIAATTTADTCLPVAAAARVIGAMLPASECSVRESRTAGAAQATAAPR